MKLSTEVSCLYIFIVLCLHTECCSCTTTYLCTEWSMYECILSAQLATYLCTELSMYMHECILSAFVLAISLHTSPDFPCSGHTYLFNKASAVDVLQYFYVYTMLISHTSPNATSIYCT